MQATLKPPRQVRIDSSCMASGVAVRAEAMVQACPKRSAATEAAVAWAPSGRRGAGTPSGVAV